MHPYPHSYQVEATAEADDAVLISSSGLSNLSSQPPEQFGGSGDYWSPETLLVAAMADCFILTFRAIARASQLAWLRLECRTDGILDRVDNVTRFTRFDIQATLKVPAGTDQLRAERILEKAEAVCLISNSLNAEKKLETRIEFAP
jgi:organic hydroperoxide reductase OsmC/OhrA